MSEIRVDSIVNAAGTGSPTFPNGVVLALTGLTDVTINAPTVGQLLRYNGTNWENFTVVDRGVAAGTLASVVATSTPVYIASANSTIIITATPPASLSLTTPTDVDPIADILTKTGHGLVAGQPVVITSTATMPAGVTAGATYFTIPMTTDTFKLAVSYENAILGSAIDITTSGNAGTMTVSPFGAVVLPSTGAAGDLVTIKNISTNSKFFVVRQLASMTIDEQILDYPCMADYGSYAFLYTATGVIRRI